MTTVKLYPFQEKIVEFCEDRRRAIIAADAGLGKTLTVLRILKDKGLCSGRVSKVGRVLVVVPASLRENFRCEIIKCGFHTSWFKIVSYEWVVSNSNNLKWLDDIKCVVVDELQDHLRNKDSLRSKALMEISKWVKFMYFLSGTPIKKSSKDIWVVAYMCSPMKWERYSDFCAKYCVRRYNQWGRKWEWDGFKNSRGLKAELAEIMIRVKKVDVLEELPELIEKEFWIENGTYEVPEESELLANKKEVREHIAKVRQKAAFAKLNHYVESLDLRGISRGIIFVWHKDVGSTLVEKLSDYKVGYITGDVVADSRLAIVERFQAGELDFLVMTVSVGGVGFNITNNDYVGFFELPFTYAEVEQAYSRTWRIGNRGCVVEYVLLKDSIDKPMYNIVMKRKRETKEAVG
jgi:SNF2 family DNA or RNA helicase